MAKKKGKKGKGKGKGKKDKKKDGLSNIEREIFLLTISELEHKILWRKHLCSIIAEDLKVYEEKLELQRNDKIDTVSLLEEAIEEQRELFEKIQRALPDVENSKIQTEEIRARELADKLMQMNEEKHSYDAQLEALRKKLETLENYRFDKVDEKIRDIEKQLESEDAEDTFLQALEQDKRKEEAFRKEMQDILASEADSFQDEISGKLDQNFERIIEETRWWADTVSGLRIATERLEVLNDIKLVKLRASQKELKQRKKNSLEESQQLQEGEAFISELVCRNKEMEDMNRSDTEFQKHLSLLDSKSEILKQNLNAQEDYLMVSFNKIRENENELNILEGKLSNEISFGSQLAKFIEKTQQLVTEEVKHSLILTYNGLPEKKKTIEELRCLFEKATKFIYDRKNKSML